MSIPLVRRTTRTFAFFFALVACIALGCASTEQDTEALVEAVSQCVWSAAHAKSPERISNEWLKDKTLMDFLHASNLGSEHLLHEAAKGETSVYSTFEEFHSAIQALANNQHIDETPEHSFLQHVPHPRNRDEQGMLTTLYLHLLHCRDYWQGPVAAEVPNHSDAISDLAECYWKRFRIDSFPVPVGSTYMSYTSRTDFVSAAQVDAIFRSAVFRFRNTTPEEIADQISKDERLMFRLSNKSPPCS